MAIRSLPPLPTGDELKSYYNEAYQVPLRYHSNGVSREAQFILRMIREHHSRRGKLLEVGCSYGFFLDAARRDGWEVCGVELDEAAANHAREKLGIEVFSGTLESECSRLRAPYDVIALFHVIEHIPRPIPFLQACRTLLADDGVLLLRTPNVDSWIAGVARSHWQWSCPPAHIHLFSPRTLPLLFAESGYQVERLRSRQGDARNNLSELICAFGRFLLSKRAPRPVSSGRQPWGNRRSVAVIDAMAQMFYWPFRTFLDPWLETKGLQPELLAIAKKA